MNKKFSMVLGAACLSAALLAGCSDDSASSGPSKAEECANGLTAECLVGEWKMLGFANKGTGAMLPEFNYTNAPGKLTFTENNTFVFDLPSGAPAVLLADTDCNPLRGTWSVSDANLVVSSKVSNFDNIQMCLGMSGTTVTLTPKVAVEGAEVKMSLGQLLLLGKATNEQSIVMYSEEIYTISAK